MAKEPIDCIVRNRTSILFTINTNIHSLFTEGIRVQGYFATLNSRKNCEIPLNPMKNHEISYSEYR